jgi:hypothetical protein
MDPIRYCVICYSWQDENTLAYWANSKVSKKLKCCEDGLGAVCLALDLITNVNKLSALNLAE